MRAEVFVTLKRGVLDPQGKAVHHAAETNGYRAISGVRQGKYFEIEIADGLSEVEAREEIERVARDILSNPVIEDYRVELYS